MLEKRLSGDKSKYSFARLVTLFPGPSFGSQVVDFDRIEDFWLKFWQEADFGAARCDHNADLVLKKADHLKLRC